MGLAVAPLARCGGLLSETSVAWDSNSNNVVVPFGRHVRVHDVSTVDSVPSRRPRTFAAHDEDVVAVATLGPARALSASRDGTLRIWDTDDNECLRAIDVGEPVIDIAVPRHDCEAWDGYVVVACRKRVISVLVAPERSTASKQRRTLFKSSVERVACDESGSVVLGIAGTSMLLAKVTKRKAATSEVGAAVDEVREEGDESASAETKSGPVKPRGRRRSKGSKGSQGSKSAKGDSCVDVVISRTQVHLPQRVTAAAVTSDGMTVAIGDVVGCVSVYREVGERLGQIAGQVKPLAAPVPSKLHWHSSAVSSLCFTGGDSVLLSGGAEAVLVSWKMSQADFGDRSFRPRLGGTIWGIAPSPDGRLLALTCGDNSVRIIDAFSMHLRAEIQGLAVPTEAISGSNRSAVLQKVRKMSVAPAPGRDGCVLVTGVGGSVQVFDVYRGEHVGFLPVAPRNSVHVGAKVGRRGVPVPRNPLVCHARMSPDGEVMATVDSSTTFEGDHTDSSELEILRFWQRNPETETLEMVARLERPHGAHGSISAVEFHPTLPIVATLSSCGGIKLWRLVTTGVKSRTLTWRCEAEETLRGLTCSALSFSMDGSLLAVGAGSRVVLWQVVKSDEPDETTLAVEGSVRERAPSSLSLEILHTFVHPPTSERVRDVRFVSGDLPAIVSRTKNGIYVWNVLTQCIWWSLRLVTGDQPISVDAGSQRFALAVDMPRTSGRSEGNTSGKKKERVDKKGKTFDRQQTGVDRSIVLFDVGSPVPLCVHRLHRGTRLRAAAFVATTDRKANSPLVYIDGDMEVHMIADEGSDLLSAVTDLDGIEGDEGEGHPLPHRLDTLLGTDWRDEAEQRALAPALTPRPTDRAAVAASLDRSFAGPTHTLAPMSVSAVDAIAAMLEAAKWDLGRNSPKVPAVDGDDGGNVEFEADQGTTLSQPSVSIDRRQALTSNNGREARLARYLAATQRLST